MTDVATNKSANLFKKEDSVSCRSNISTIAFCCLESKFSKIGMLYKSIAKLRECAVVCMQSAGGVEGHKVREIRNPITMHTSIKRRPRVFAHS